MMFEREESSVIVTQIDHEKLLAKILEDSRGDLEGVVGLDIYGQKLCYIKTPRGTYVLDHECCGIWGDEKPVTVDHPVVLKLYLKRNHDSIPMLPEMDYMLTPEVIESLPIKGVMRLDQWARNYNDRCEQNYKNWNHHLTLVLAG